MARQGHNGSLELVDFELLTWITSALEIRLHSPMHLITDSEGAEFFHSSGLGWLYDGISTDLNAIPAEINPSIFWDGGKMFAFQSIETPCVLLDYDAILWGPLEPRGDVMALHEEQRSWSFYAPNREKFERFGFDAGRWNWEVNPVNTGLVYFGESRLPRDMGSRSVEFMVDYSNFARTAPAEERLTPPKYNRATLFAGQRLLPMCADQKGMTVELITSLHPDLLTLAKNPTCSHFWISKALYKCVPEARVAMVNHLITQLLEKHPVCRETLERFGLSEPIALDPNQRMDFRTLSPTDARRRMLRRISSCAGDVRIEDASLTVFRPGAVGSFVLPGEQIHLGSGAKCELAGAEDEIFDE